MRHSKAMNAMPDMIYVAIAIFTFDLKSGKKELCGMQNFSSYILKVLVLGQKKSGRGRVCICGGPYVLGVLRCLQSNYFTKAQVEYKNFF